MPNQSKNRVKLNRSYKKIGIIPDSALKKISNFKPMSLVLAVLLDNSNHIAAVHLHYDKNEKFWLVTTVHAIKLKELEKMTLIWEK